MSRIETATYWTDGRGNRHDITKMSDDYIMNCIAWLGRRNNELIEQMPGDQSSDEHKAIQSFVIDNASYIKLFVLEMGRRHKEGIKIDRNMGCEENY